MGLFDSQESLKKAFIEAHNKSLNFPSLENQRRAKIAYEKLNDRAKAQLKSINIEYK